MIYFISLLIGAAGAFSISKWALYFGLIDKPNHRSSHDRPTPKGGGIGILAAFIPASIITGFPAAYWLPISIVAIVGLLGDRTNLSLGLRLCIQFGAAIAVFSLAFSLKNPLLLAFWVVFIVGTANCYNFMDGINGIAGIAGIVGFTFVGIYLTGVKEMDYIVPVAISVTFSCAGFLPFNMPRARVFMGDVGSIQLGFLFGTVVCLASKNLLDFFCLISFMFPFYSDEIITKVVQIMNGDGLTQPHRKHVYQLLANELGVPHWKISISYGFLQLLVGISVLSVMHYGVSSVLMILLAYFTFAIAVNLSVRHRVKNL